MKKLSVNIALVGIAASAYGQGQMVFDNIGNSSTNPAATANGLFWLSTSGTPVLIKDLGTVAFGPDIRQGVAEWQGEGEAVGGIVVMRDGMNALNVIDGIKHKLEEIKSSLPAGVEVVPAYDRSGLIHASIHTLQRDLVLEAIIVSVVTIVFLFHFRSALIPILTLPIAVLISFIPMYYLDVTSNIMSLGGLALAIGVLVDASIVGGRIIAQYVKDAYSNVRVTNMKGVHQYDVALPGYGQAGGFAGDKEMRTSPRPVLPGGKRQYSICPEPFRAALACRNQQNSSRYKAYEGATTCLSESPRCPVPYYPRKVDPS